MSVLSPARRAALDLVSRIRRSKMYARDYLRTSSEMAQLSKLDRALATRLVLGTIAAQGELDICIDVHLSGKTNFEPKARDALRISAFELLYLDTPKEVVVDQAVELVRCVTPRLAGMTNAVMRRIAEEDCKRLQSSREFVREGVGEASDFARVAAFPEWLCWEILESLGVEHTSELALDALQAPPYFVHANTYSQTEAEAFSRLEELDTHPCPTCFPHCYSLENPAPFAKSELIDSCDFIVADLAASAVSELIPLHAHARFLEIGQGRATKSLLLAFNRFRELKDVDVSCIEKDAHKLEISRERLTQAGTGHNFKQYCLDGRYLGADEQTAAFACSFDSVFLDAPCSGTGTLRRHPEITWSLDSDSLEQSLPTSLPALQLELMCAAASCVKSGGYLSYSTCSVLCQENEGVIEAFLGGKEGGRFKLVNPLVQLQERILPEQLSYFEERIDSQGYFHSLSGTFRSDIHFAAVLQAD